MPPKMTANPARPSRYRAGKPTGVDSDSSSDEDENNSGSESTAAQAKRKPTTAAPAAPSRPSGPGRVVTHASLAKAISQQRDVSGGGRDDGAGDDAEAKRKARVALEAKAAQEGFVTESEEGSEDGSEDDDDDDEDDDEESDSSSEDDVQPRKFTLPKFMTKAQREAEAAKAAEKAKKVVGPQRRKPGDEDDEDNKEEEPLSEELDEEAARQKALDDMVVEQLQKQAAARVAKKKQWEDSNESHAAAAVAMLNAGDADEGVAPIVDFNADVDTEDDVDPEAEHAAWKLRELKRIKRQRERIEEKERELEELERRRNLTEEERQAEDAVKLAAQRDEKEARGKMAYMQKYHHKGAFFQDDLAAEGLDKRDLMGARYVDEIQNRDLLPKALQIRDAARLGKKGASKYRDLKSEDTGRWGSGLLDDDRGHNNNRYDSWGRERPGFSASSGGGGWGGGGGFGRGEADVNGANAIPLGPRKREERPRHSDQKGDQEISTDKARDGDRGRDHRDRRSRSPRRDRDRDVRRDRSRGRHDDYKDERRKRSPPSRDGRDRDRDRDRDRHRDRDRERDRSRDRHGDKRRRIET